MTLSRRQVLTLGGLTASAASLGALGFLGRERLRELLFDPAIPGPGPLDPKTVDAATAAIEAFIPAPIRRANHAAYLRWRARTSPFHRPCYQRLVLRLDQWSEGEYAVLDLDRRRSVLVENLEAAFEALPEIAEPTDAQGYLESLREPSGEALLFVEMVFREAVGYFSHTDLLLGLGYETWAGQARGFESYTTRRSSGGLQQRPASPGNDGTTDDPKEG